MGMSITIASAIVLVGWVIFVGAISAAIFSTINDIGSLVNSASTDKVKLMARLSLGIESIENRSVNFTVANIGSREIFLRNDTFAWNSVIIYYNNTDWQNYLIENYTVLHINATGTDISFDVTTHRCIKPGEEALIQVDLPSEAPDILETSLVTVIFASHYGVTASQEAYVSQYGERTLMSGMGASVFSEGNIATDYVR